MDAALSSLLPQFDLLMPEGHLMPDAPILRMVRAHFMQVRSGMCVGEALPCKNAVGWSPAHGARTLHAGAEQQLCWERELCHCCAKLLFCWFIQLAGGRYL